MPDSLASLESFSAGLRSAFPLEDLLTGLLETSLTAVVLFIPIRGADGEIADFRIELLNDAAQRMLGQPARPNITLLQQFPHALESGVFVFHCAAFNSPEPLRMDVNYQSDGLDNYYHLLGRRVGEGLLMNFDDTADHDRTAVEVALRESQARERAAWAEAESQRDALHGTFMQAPAMICIFVGPEHMFELVNPPYQRLVGDRPLLGRPIREAMPELAGQPIFDLLDNVYRTGETFRANEMLVQLDNDNTGPQELEKRYYNFIYQPRRNAQDVIDGIVVFAYEVTTQVQARQQVVHSEQQTAHANEELAAANEELQAANEEIRSNNDDLFRAQITLRELNQQLEARVTDRTVQVRAARTEAERQRARLERFFMQAPAAICILDGPELVYELVNPAYQALFPQRELLGRPIAEAFPELIDHAVLATFREVYESGRTNEEQAILIQFTRPSDGVLEDRYFNYIQQARYDEHGQIDGVMVFAFEVTEQVRSQQHADDLQAAVLAAAQRRAHERETFYQIFEQTPAAICVQREPGHRYEYVNAAYQELFPGRQLRGLTLAEAVPEIVAAGFLDILNEVYRSGETYYGYAVPFTLPATADRPARERFYTFTYQAFQEEGLTVGITTFAYDVTGQVLSQRQRETEQQQLNELFEQAPVAIAVLRGAEFVVELANPGMCALWGRTRETVLGTPLLRTMPELREQGFGRLMEGVMSTGMTYVSKEQAVQLPRADQPVTLHVNFVYQPLRDGNQHVTGVVVVATDVSEQVDARQLLARINAELTAANQAVSLRNAELDTANQRLVRTNQDLDNFVYAASHDLKQPVHNLAGLFAELRLCTTFTDPAEGEVLLPMVEDALRQLATTINDLAAVGQSQGLNQPAETVSLTELTQEVLQTLQPQVAAARARVTTDFDARPTIVYSRANLRTILLNLLSNALKYADPARPARVHLSLWLAHDRPVLLVEDNGLGFDVQRHRKELFSLFRRFHDHTDGTGVGLYLVNRIVQSNGGRVEVESEVGVGSTFRLFL